jgi:hypothetical protein
VEKLLREWMRAVAEAHFHEATAFCAPRGARQRALYEARIAEQRAARLAKLIERRYNIDPHEAIRNGEIK